MDEKIPTILVIDDYEDFADSLKGFFNLEGFNAHVALNAAEAESLCRENEYDFALVDVMLPDAQGDVLVGRLRKIQPNIDCLIMTGNATLESAMNSVGKPGIISYEIKPLDMGNVMSLIREVVARKRAEENLSASEARYRKLVEDSPFGVCIVSDGKIVFTNTKMFELTGFTPEEMKGFEDFLAPVLNQERSGNESPDSSKYSGGVPGEIIFKTKKKDGSSLVLRVHISYDIVFDNKPAIMAFVEDVTDRTRLRKQMMRSQKYSLIAQLSMNLHHEIKNPLAIISGHTQTLQTTPEIENIHDDDIEYSFTVIQKQVERISSTLNNLAMLGRESRFSFQPLDLKGLLEKVCTMFSPRLAKAGIELKTQFHCDIMELPMADESRLLHVFANIMFNSIESMPEGGEIEISVSRQETGRFLEVVIRDTGCGIPERNMDQIFDPFFSTKPDGTGMGLALTRTIVDDHEGTMLVESEVDVGTAVTVMLPCVSNKE